MSASRTRFYLDKRNGKIMGVCAGIADYFGWDVTLVRIGFALGAILGSGSTILAYLVIGWVANSKPAMLYDESPERMEFWRDVRVQPKRTLRDVNAQFRDADRRLRDLEFHLTSESRQLADEIEKLR
ncbi:envelope stress response membrane protein PspC [Sandarakinorhabdus oryzae]|uniref:envelope stress response membrane protein PspC n=1 Tax=Sandarakinorhabdus oryzae TaxID=2675220 RepID=UPI0012E1F106|nr:envelope stress response membrane protein PspC [Sandarakinorhabdus oryzae]